MDGFVLQTTRRQPWRTAITARHFESSFLRTLCNIPSVGVFDRVGTSFGADAGIQGVGGTEAPARFNPTVSFRLTPLSI